jgi:hypothetical protein
MRPPKTDTVITLALLVVSGLFAAWAGYFIYSTSLVAPGGQRYFSLFDDAMISMRYAWNLAHGHGLVWNPGEHVEGYTNLLMVLIMAIPNALLEQRFAVLSIHLFGIVTMLGIAFVTSQIALILVDSSKQLVRLLSFTAVLLYYPLVYWTVMGMETGLLTLLFLTALWALLSYERTGDVRRAHWMAILLGLSYLTRPEVLLPGGLMLLYMFYISYWGKPRDQRLAWSQLAVIGVLFISLPLAQHIFRWFYYRGELFANTYQLKAEGLPVRERIEYGMNFTEPFLREHALLLALAAVGIVFRFSRVRLLFVAIITSLIVYQIYIGGDVPEWTYWRIVAPVMPLALVLLFDTLLVRLPDVFRTWLPSPRTRYIVILLGLLASGVALHSALARFQDEQTFAADAFNSVPNANDVTIALLLDQITTERASLGLFWAGTIPYYNPDRYAIDYLGKADAHIAGLTPKPDDPLRHWPGHNKRDLAYSIQTLQPTYSQGFALGSDDVRLWAKQHYTLFVYDNDIYLYLKNNDSTVNLEKGFALGLFPWVQWSAEALFPNWFSQDDTRTLMPANTYGVTLPESVVTPEQIKKQGALNNWQRTRLPNYLRQAGIDYLLVDSGWWSTLSEPERQTLLNMAYYQPVEEWQAAYIFLRLYRVTDPAARSG